MRCSFVVRCWFVVRGLCQVAALFVGHVAALFIRERRVLRALLVGTRVGVTRLVGVVAPALFAGVAAADLGSEAAVLTVTARLSEVGGAIALTVRLAVR